MVNVISNLLEYCPGRCSDASQPSVIYVIRLVCVFVNHKKFARHCFDAMDFKLFCWYLSHLKIGCFCELYLVHGLCPWNWTWGDNLWSEKTLRHLWHHCNGWKRAPRPLFRTYQALPIHPPAAQCRVTNTGRKLSRVKPMFFGQSLPFNICHKFSKASCQDRALDYCAPLCL